MDNSTWRLHFSKLPRGLSVVPISVSLFILINNIVILSVFKRMRILKLHHYFMIGLSLADILTLAPYSVITVTMANGSLWLTQDLCDVLGLMLITSLQATSWIHSAMCIEKCVSVTMPVVHHTLSTKKYILQKVVLVIVICFAVPIVSCLKFLHMEMLHITFYAYIPGCTFIRNTWLYVVQGSLFVAFPMVIQLLTHAVMLHKVMTLSKTNRKRKLRAMSTVTLTVGIYYACWMPLVVQVIWNSFKPSPPWFDVVPTHILVANSGMSLIIYVISLQEFKLKSLLPARFSNRTTCFIVHIKPIRSE